MRSHRRFCSHALLFAMLTASATHAQSQAIPQCPSVDADGRPVLRDCAHKTILQTKPAPPAVSQVQIPISEPSSTGLDATMTSDPDYRAAAKQLALNEIRYKLWTNDFAQSQYVWQYRASILIFFLVVALVFAGIYFAWIQFQATLHVAKSISKTPQEPSGSPESEAVADPPKAEASEFRFGKDGIVIQSSFIGLIILAISFAFFILYLKYVYPIT